MEIVVIRHSIAEGNLRHVFLGRTDDPLAPCGVELACKRREELPRVERVYHSPMLRARCTARLVWPETMTTEVPGLREMDFGLFDGRTNDELMEDPLYRGWLAQGEWKGYPGGETFAQAKRRCDAAFRSLVRDAAERGLSRIGAVMHGGTVMSIMEMYTGLKLNYTDLLVKNCAGFLLDTTYSKGKVVVSGWEKI
jgi:alpha-ribazole phosphatase